VKVLPGIFGAAVRAKNALYDRNTIHASQLNGPVVSVGNLSVGGTGKTPFVILLGGLLKARGIPFDVLSRGYGRRTSKVHVVDPSGVPTEFGDEPLLIAQKLQVPVVIGKERYEAGIVAEKKYGPQLHLLDDGFQHRRLAREFDIVIISAEDLKDDLLPAGRLREPVSSLRRADVAVLPEELEVDLPEAKHVWRLRRDIELSSPPAKPIAFCGIARPDKFVSQLGMHGVRPVANRFFRDHHSYSAEDVEGLLALQRQTQASGFITTEKDAINLGRFSERLQPLIVAKVTMQLLDPDNAVDTMLRIIAERKPRRERILSTDFKRK
jgi:tetraacyldisaccharide 4'-kinase